MPCVYTQGILSRNHEVNMELRQNTKLTNEDAVNAYWVALLLRALPDDLRDRPLSDGYPSPSGVADIIERHVDLDGLTRHFKMLGYCNTMLTLPGEMARHHYTNYGAQCVNPIYFLRREHFLSPAYDGIYHALRYSEATNWFSEREHANNFHEVGDRMDWEAREYLRLQRQYASVPWDISLDRIPGHFAHISTQDPTKVAYTPSEEYGKRNRKITLRPGRYLKQFYPHLSDPVIANLVGDMGRDYAEYELGFAVTAEEIERVYTRGPSSCMSKRRDVYMSCVHPVHVYGNSDLQLAYLRLKKEDRITSRALVWPEKKAIGRVYGDSLRIMKMLGDLGYTQEESDGSDLIGAKIRRIEDERYDDCLVMPYIDGTQAYREVNSEWVVIADSGDDACYQHGLNREDPGPRCTCERCEESYDEDDMYCVTVGRRESETWCNHCRGDHATWCHRSDEYVADNVAGAVLVRTRTRTRGYEEVMWATWHIESDTYYCDRLDARVDDSVPSYEMENGETWSEFAFREDGIEIDGKYYDKADIAKEPALATSEADAWSGLHGDLSPSKSWHDLLIVAAYTTNAWERSRFSDEIRKEDLARALAA
jgi:hypothetical protein